MSDYHQTVQAITKGLYLYKLQSTSRVEILYELESTLFSFVEIEVDLSGCENLRVESLNDAHLDTRRKSVVTIIPPFRKMRIARLIPQDSSCRSALKVKLSWKIDDTLVDDYDEAIAQANIKINVCQHLSFIVLIANRKRRT